MMYSEFIELSGKSEKYISASEYATLIEPLYIQCDIDKQDFVALFNVLFERIVYPVINQNIQNLAEMDNLEVIKGEQNILEYLQEIDFEARKLVYQCISLYSKTRVKTGLSA